MKRYFIIFLVLPFVVISCENNNEKNLFEGVTETNSNGEILFEDQTDWNFSDNWNEKEESLFSEHFENSCFFDDSYNIIVYPNPCDEIFNLQFNVPEGKRIAYRIVNNDYKVLYSIDSASSITSFNVNYINVKNEIIRVYYKVLGENCELKGHGDIKVK